MNGGLCGDNTVVAFVPLVRQPSRCCRLRKSLVLLSPQMKAPFIESLSAKELINVAASGYDCPV